MRKSLANSWLLQRLVITVIKIPTTATSVDTQIFSAKTMQIFTKKIGHFLQKKFWNIVLFENLELKENLLGCWKGNFDDFQIVFRGDFWG